jgi:hypothetical protein
VSADEPVRVDLEVGVDPNSLKPSELRAVFKQITEELSDPNSELSQKTSGLGLKVSGIGIDEDQAFILETVLIWVAVHVAGGAAGAAGAMFFNKVVKPRIESIQGDGIGDIKDGPPEGGDGDRQQ